VRSILSIEALPRTDRLPLIRNPQKVGSADDSSRRRLQRSRIIKRDLLRKGGAKAQVSGDASGILRRSVLSIEALPRTESLPLIRNPQKVGSADDSSRRRLQRSRIIKRDLLRKGGAKAQVSGDASGILRRSILSIEALPRTDRLPRRRVSVCARRLQATADAARSRTSRARRARTSSPRRAASSLRRAVPRR